LTTHCLSARTIRIAPAIVITQSSTTRTPCGSPGKKRPSGSLTGSSTPHHLAAPGVDPRMVAGKEHVRNRPASELGWARVLRVLETAPELGREALQLAGPLGQRAREVPRDRVENDHRRQVSVREDIRADGDRVGGEMLDDALVEALEARRQ